MKRTLLLPFLLLLMALPAHAQYNTPQNYNWTFGNRGGVNFSSGSASAFTSAMNTSEGCATVSDASGALLFYTDGYDIYNRTGSVMPSGGGIVSYTTSSTSQSTVIIPVIGSTSKYYVFSLESLGGSGRLKYCIVDMTLAAGLGGVISTTRGTALNTSMGEHMIAVAGNNCNIWLVTHKETGRDFYVYEITSSGISSATVTTIGTFTASTGYSIGQFKISPDRTKLGCTVWNNGSYVANGVGVELYDFDPSTGGVSNCRRLDSLNCAYGSEFSSDNTKYYVCYNTSSGSTKVDQFTDTGSTAAIIRSSRTTIHTVSTGQYPSLKLARDNKIYLCTMSGSSGFLDCIPSPNVAGTGCGFTSHAVTLSSGTSSVYGLPNLYFSVGGGDTTVKHFDTTVCIRSGSTITLAADTVGTGYFWDNGATTATDTFSTYGIHWVAISNGCSINVDTFNVIQQPRDTLSFRHDSTICILLSPITLTARSGYPFYEWSDGTTGTTTTAATSGSYWVQQIDSCGNVLVDTFHIYFHPIDTTIGFSYDTAVCVTVGSITLTAATGYTAYNWNTGSTAATIRVGTSGSYWVYQLAGCAVKIDTYHVTFIPQPVVNIGNDTAFCVGTTLTLSTSQPAGYNLLWSDGTTGTSMVATATGTYWLQVSNGCTVTDSIHITISPYPVVDLGPDQFNCNGLPVTLSSSVSYTSPTYLWSDGSGGSTDVVNVDGYYWLKVTVAGCSSADTVHVVIIYDTLHLYNRDTAICKGNIVQAIASNNPDATYQWIPTAGIAVSNFYSPIIAPDTSAMYVINMYVTGCPVVSDSFFIDVQPLPTVRIVGGNRFVCQYDSIHIHANVDPAWYANYKFRWSPAADLDDSTSRNVVFTAGTSKQYILTVSTANGCTGIDSFKVLVNPGNFLTIGPDVSMCPHDSAQFTVVSSEGGTFLWVPPLYLSDSTSGNPWVHAITTQAYEVIGTSTSGCHDTAHVKATVFPNAVIFAGDSVTLYPGQSVNLNPTTNCVSLAWFPPYGLSDPTGTNPVATPSSSTMYWVTGVTQDGCHAKDSVKINVTDESVLSTPNAFAPDGSNNQRFKIVLEGAATLNYFRIYNRWGNVVFETTNIFEGWDGNYNGKPQPQDVYIYDIQAATSTGRIVNKKGNLTLLR